MNLNQQKHLLLCYLRWIFNRKKNYIAALMTLSPLRLAQFFCLCLLYWETKPRIKCIFLLTL